MNNQTDSTVQCLSVKDGLSIASLVMGFLLLISEILPFVRPKDKYNGLIQSIQTLLQEHARRRTI